MYLEARSCALQLLYQWTYKLTFDWISLSLSVLTAFPFFPYFPASDLKVTLLSLFPSPHPLLSHTHCFPFPAFFCVLLRFLFCSGGEKTDTVRVCGCVWSRWPSRQHQEPESKCVLWLVRLPLPFISHKSPLLLFFWGFRLQFPYLQNS